MIGKILLSLWVSFFRSLLLLKAIDVYVSNDFTVTLGIFILFMIGIFDYSWVID